jgi:histidine triad (HIT) family protein
MDECIFCNVAAQKGKADVVYRDEQVTAFRDIRPSAPVHVLIIPNRHIASVNELTEADQNLAGRLLVVARQIAENEGIAESGYRLILNTGPDSGQIVFHIHLHLLGGQPMRHPLG